MSVEIGWKGYVHYIAVHYHRRQSWGWGSRLSTPQILGRESWGVAGGRREGRGRVVKYYYILSCIASMFESFKKSNRIICPGIAVNSQYLPGKSKFLGKLP